MSAVGPWRPDASGDRSDARHRRRLRRADQWSSETALESPVVRDRLSTRLRVAEVVAIVMVGLLLFGFWRLQVVHAAHYRDLAENNRRRNVVVRAPRGLMTDRAGNLLAANRPAFNIAVVREELGDRRATLEWLAGVLAQPVEELEARLDEKRGVPDFQPVVIAEDIPGPLVPAIEVRTREFPGVTVQPEHKRYYPEGLLAAHVLGHVGEITRQQLDAWEAERFRMGDIIGQIGLERVHNDALSGHAGAEELVVNSAGRTMGVFNRTAPEPGKTLTLTVDLPLQREVETALGEKKGAVVVLDVRTGGILAMASGPTFDPNMFARRFSTGEWDALINDPDKPMQNRALQGAYPPGSVFKLLMAIVGLERGLITPETTVFCPGGGVYHGQYRACNVGGGHGRVNLKSAIGRSCNVYFYELGEKLGREPIVEVASRFGLGVPTGVDLPNERAGTLPTDAWLQRARADGVWYPGETIGLAIGQGPIDTTPLQLAHMVATLSTGVDRTPHLVRAEQDPAGRAVPRTRAIAEVDVGLRPAHRAAVLEGMWAVVNDNGSGWRARNPDVPYGGKTGTAQVASSAAAGPEEDRPEELRNHAWFVGVAPVDDPEIAIAVLIEHGGGGGAAAAPVAGQVLDAYFAAREVER